MKRIFFLLMTASIALNTGCNKIFESNATYTIKGRMLKDCNGEPIANYHLRLYYRGGVLPPLTLTSTDLAFDTTDNQGYFSFEYIPVKYNGSLSVQHDVDDITTIRWTEVMSLGNIKDNEVLYWNFYGSYTTLATTKIIIDKSKFGSSDTMYVGRSHNNYEYFYPIPSDTLLRFSDSYTRGLAREDDSLKIFWGVGHAFYDSLTKNHYRTPDDKTFMLECKMYLCTEGNVQNLHIP